MQAGGLWAQHTTSWALLLFSVMCPATPLSHLPEKYMVQGIAS